MTKSMTHEEFIQKCKEQLEYFDEYEILSKYESSRKEIKIRHKKCNSEPYSILPSHFLYDKRQCKKCNKGRAGSKSLTEKEFIEKLNELGNNEYILDSDYNGLSKKIKLIHNCGEILECTPSEFINRNKRCKYCSGKKTNLKILSEKINNIDNEYILDMEKSKDINYKGVHTPIYINHKKCKTSFPKSFNNFRNGQRCPICEAKNQESKACIDIKKYLDDNNIRYETEVTREGLIYIKPLRFDFYLPDYDIYIEYDGKQHFKYENNGIFTEEKFEIIKTRDDIKNNFCKENNLVLYRINYLEDHIKKLKIILEESSTTIETTSVDGRE